MKKVIRILFLATMLITVSCNSKKVENTLVQSQIQSGIANLAFNFSTLGNETKVNSLSVKLKHSTGREVTKDILVDSVTNIASANISGLEVGDWSIGIKLFDIGNSQIGTGSGKVRVEGGKTSKAYTSIEFNSGDIINPSEGTRVVKLDNTGDFEYELNNLSGEDVYFIFTNESDSEISKPTIIKNINSQAITRNLIDVSDDRVLPEIPEMGSSRITESNRELAEKLKKSPKSNSISRNISEPQKLLVEGAKEIFFGGNSETVPATLRKIQSAHGKNLYMWVADHSWYDGGTKATKVEQYMVNILADKFLKEETDNDIYEWVSNIVGEPWGTTQYDNLINDDGSMHLLLYDIGNDNSINGGVCGYYWAKHNFKKTSYATSNEKLMFAIDSVMFAKAEGSTWEITDFWPQFMISTLAHEFQHMINWYQKVILRDTDSDSWVNELASMSVEDLVARKILADGPRGVNYNTATAGELNNPYGRIPLYNQNNNKKLTDWTQDLPSYSMSYTFGAYLMRNYGGANFIQNLVQNNKDSKESVTEALRLSGHSNLTFNDVLRNFAVANLLSDSTNNELGYRFNKDTWETSTINGINYDLGAINLYNFSNKPKVVDTLPSTLNGVSNNYYNAGKALIGNNKWTISGLDPNVKMTVVIKK